MTSRSAPSGWASNSCGGTRASAVWIGLAQPVVTDRLRSLVQQGLTSALGLGPLGAALAEGRRRRVGHHQLITLASGGPCATERASGAWAIR